MMGNGKVPSITSIMQSSNLYAYCINNPIMFVDPSGEDIWYFAGNEKQFKSQTSKNEKLLNKRYEEPIHVIYSETNIDFITEWNKMGTWDGENVDISLVIIDMHGNPDSISPTENPVDSITTFFLDEKPIGNIVVLGCNSGHFDHRYSSFVNQMLVKNNLYSIVAADGTVKGSSNIFSNKVRYSTLSNDDFVSYLWSGKKYRNDFGFIKYTKNSIGELEWEVLGRKFDSLDSLLNKAGL